MSRLFILLFLLSLVGTRSVTAQVQNDKVKHFVAGAVIGTAGGLLASELSDKNTFWIITGAVGSSLIAGAVKEAIDANNENNSWNNGDLAATGLGGLTAGVTISIFTGKSKRKRVARMALADFPDQTVILSRVLEAPPAE